MKKISLSVFLSIILYNVCYSQLSKGTWLTGGNGSFTSSPYSEGPGRNALLTVAPKAGYFLMNKLAVGLNLAFQLQGLKTPDYHYSDAYYGFGPFVRYYFLPSKKPINLFAEAAYQHYLSGTVNFAEDIFSFSAGPVIYLNSHIGVEFTVGYTINNSVYSNDVNHIIQTGVGFQIHLGKKK